jgi:hypothetical protein
VTGALRVDGATTVNNALYANTIQGTGNVGFSTAGTGSDVNVVGVSIPNYSTVQKTVVDVTVNYQNTVNTGSMYLVLNTGDYMVISAYNNVYSSGWNYLTNPTVPTNYGLVASNVTAGQDVHLCFVVHGRLSSVQWTEISVDYLQKVSVGSVPAKTLGNA